MDEFLLTKEETIRTIEMAFDVSVRFWSIEPTADAVQLALEDMTSIRYSPFARDCMKLKLDEETLLEWISEKRKAVKI